MIDHAKILIGLFGLLTGVGVIVLLFQNSRKYGYPFLRTIYQYSIYMLILFMGIVVSKYIKLNISGVEIDGRMDVYLNLGTLILILTQLGMLYTLLSSCLHLNQVSIPILVHRTVFTMVVLVCVSYIIRIVLAAYGISVFTMNHIHSMLWNSLSLLELPILLIFIFYQNPQTDPERQKISRSFALLFFSRFPVTLCLLYMTRFVHSEAVKLLFPVGFFFCYIFVPLIWIRYYFRRYADSLLSQLEYGTNFSEVFKQFEISVREQEIMVLLLKGNTNREIADSLFIAIPTVKNHIYNIYQKLGVNTRYQLIHLVSRYGHQNRTPENN